MTLAANPESIRGGFDIPVALIVYNRPEFTRRLIAALRPACPRHILIIADGPNLERSGDDTRCQQVRAAVAEIDWPCEVELNAADNNLGCRKRPQTGLAWVFERVQEVIVLEDDCIPDPTFFPFCRELLIRYRDDPRVMIVSGMSILSHVPCGPESYYFSIHSNCHGWATWRRTWAIYDDNIDSWPTLRSTDWLQRIVGDRRDALFWAERFDMVRNGFDAWDFQLVFSCWKAGGLSIRPRHDLVQNIGYGPDATHTFDPQSDRPKSRAKPMTFPIVHPKQIDSWDVVRDSIRARFRTD
jgi:hypothetical protein